MEKGDICVLRVVGGKEEIIKINDWYWQSWSGAFSLLK